MKKKIHLWKKKYIYEKKNLFSKKNKNLRKKNITHIRILYGNKKLYVENKLKCGNNFFSFLCIYICI